MQEMQGGSVNQRWRERVHSFRPNDCIRTSEYDVAAIAQDAPVRAFVERHHYSGTYPAARFRFGLYRRGELAGVAVFSHPCSDRVLTSVFAGTPALAAVELGRFVLLDSVPGNGETWFLARCFEQLPQSGIVGVVSFSDPVARSTAQGLTVFSGHIGTIYQAHNAAYLGRGTARTLRLLPDGRVFSDRAIQKIRSGDKGWIYSAEQLQAWGAAPVEYETRREWLTEWLPRLTRTMRHPGNHKYAWGLQRHTRRSLASQAYPKKGFGKEQIEVCN